MQLSSQEVADHLNLTGTWARMECAFIHRQWLIKKGPVPATKLQQAELMLIVDHFGSANLDGREHWMTSKQIISTASIAASCSENRAALFTTIQPSMINVSVITTKRYISLVLLTPITAQSDIRV